MIDSTSGPTPIPREGGKGLKLPTFKSQGRWTPWASSPLLRCPQGPSKSHLIDITKDAYMVLISLKIPRLFGARVSDRRKTKYMLLIINHRITDRTAQMAGGNCLGLKARPWDLLPRAPPSARPAAWTTAFIRKQTQGPSPDGKQGDPCWQDPGQP